MQMIDQMQVRLIETVKKFFGTMKITFTKAKAAVAEQISLASVHGRHTFKVQQTQLLTLSTTKPSAFYLLP